MKAVFFIGKEKYGGVKNKLYADEVVSRQSITVKESSALGKGSDGYYVQIDGNEKAIEKASELLGNAARKLKGKEEKEIISAIEGQESTAAEGFGAIFG